jgi:16S rRNA (adenine1518-N6/adenine1519-N6)-dimethyltransferase
MDQSFRPRKSLGQNFLTDDNIARKIVRTAEINSTDVVLEIGAGKGALTKYLVEQARRVVAVEIDERAARFLVKRFEKECAAKQLLVVQQDILKVDFLKISRKVRSRLRVIGNIPYYITTPILFKVIEQQEVVRDLTMLMQREVGKRIVAKPGTKDYGILSVFGQYYGAPKLLFKVSPKAFSPEPKVFSVLLRLDFEQRPAYRLLNEEIFVAVVRGTFGKRRKTLRNGLRHLKLEGLDLSKLRLNLNVRPEQLSVQEFVELSNEISQQLGPPSLQESPDKRMGLRSHRGEPSMSLSE